MHIYTVSITQILDILTETYTTPATSDLKHCKPKLYSSHFIPYKHTIDTIKYNRHYSNIFTICLNSSRPEIRFPLKRLTLSKTESTQFPYPTTHYFYCT